MATEVTTGGDGNGRPGMRVQPRYPGTEARAGKFPGPSLIPALTAIQRRVGWLPREEVVARSGVGRPPR
jgi:formate dehydrogenase/NADH-quinone oxidoreductase subunit F